LSISGLISPAISSILSRSEDPANVIGGYGLSLSIIMLVAFPHLRTQQLTIIFAESYYSIIILRKFLLRLLLLVLVVSILLVIPYVNNFIFDVIFNITGELKIQASQSLIWLIPLPCLLIIKMHFYGLALKFLKPGIIWTGTTFGTLSILIICIFLIIFSQINGASIGSISMTVGTLLEIIFVHISLKRKISFDNKQFVNSNISMIKITRFFLPLCFAALIPSITFPLINSGLTRTPTPEISISAVSIGVGIFYVIAMATNGIQSTSITLMTRGINFNWIRNFSLGVGIITLAIALIFIHIQFINNLIIIRLIGLSGTLSEETIKTLKILSFLPPILVIEQFYSAYLIFKKNTLPLVYINLWRLLVLISWIYISIFYTNFSGTTIGAGACAITLTSEALITWIYAKKNIKNSL